VENEEKNRFQIEKRMNRDFTLNKYRELCIALCSHGYTVCTVADYLENHHSEEKIVILRHDVDRKLQHAVRMAEIEHEFGIKSSYYFRYNKSVFNPASIQRIADKGHEVGYHYETLDKAKGDYKIAIRIFEDELVKFREIAEVKTICMHGNPLTRWLNRDLWKEYDFRDFGITGEAFLSFNDIPYFSDTGRTWTNKHKVKDYLPSAEPDCGGYEAGNVLKCTDDLIILLASGRIRSAYILTHPERWSNGSVEWVISHSMDMAVNLIKTVFGLGERAQRC